MVSSRFLDIDQILAEEEDLQVQLLSPIFNGEPLEYGQLCLAPPGHARDTPNDSQPHGTEALPQGSEAPPHGKEPPPNGKEAPPNSTEAPPHPKKPSPSQKISTLPKDSRLKCPAWLALRLAASSLAKIQLPFYFSEEAMTAVLADPEHSALREKCNFFYEFGLILAGKVDGKLGVTLAEIFLQRVKKMIVLVLMGEGHSGSEFFFRLANSEQRVYEKAREFMVEYRLWESGRVMAELAQAGAKCKKLKTS